MTLDETIKHAEEVTERCEFDTDWGMGNHFIDRSGVADVIKCGEEHRQLAEWLKELRVFKSRRGEWLRMSDLSDQEDDRYKCSHCGNVVHYKDKMNLYTFNSWCGRCGSDNGRHINYEVEE